MSTEDEYELPIRQSDETLAHIGVLHKSGRYPWGSGDNPYERSMGFLGYVDSMRKKGLSDSDIAKGIGDEGIKTPEFRANLSIAKNEVKKADISRAMILKDKGLSNVAIGKLMKKNESSVRALLDPENQNKADALQNTANVLRKAVEQHTYLDVGKGTEHHMGISDNQLKTAVAFLQEEGYKKFYLKVPQLGTSHDTTQQVLTSAEKTFPEVVANQEKVRTIAEWSEDGGLSYKGLVPPKQIDAKRVTVRAGDEGGADKDGIIELRRGVEDISMGAARYAQVRVAVGGEQYLKGMAMYADDLPDGVDIRFNTNKSREDLKSAVASGKAKSENFAAMKPQKSDDPANPFGSIVRQKTYLDSKGKEQLSALNIVNEEGVWKDWSSKLSSQFLSKQSPSLAKEQLNMRYDTLKTELDDISKLTNPAVKRKLLETFADNADSSSVHLQAAGLPRTKSHVILPITSLKDNEIYAPGYNNGEKVVLVRHPHGGIFEIPELVVNNRNQEAKRLIPNAIDAVGINARVAERLSGADFDGDTVLVIPNDSRKVKTAPSLLALKNFNPKVQYKKYDGMKVMTSAEKQQQMGIISNLITDMTIKDANQAELARAVKHSMVVIDAEKHELNYKQSALDNNIKELKAKYQNGANKGASTLISQTTSRKDINERKPHPTDENTVSGIDKKTGKLAFVDKPGYIVAAHDVVNKKTGVVTHVPEQTRFKTFQSTKGAETDNAHTLSSGTPIESLYADYSNSLKALANKARKTMITTAPMKINHSAKETYKPEVDHLKAQLNTALKNAPLERQAQVLANALVKQKKAAKPDMEKSDLKKIQGQALDQARERVGAKKADIKISDRQWEAIQAGAISTNILEQILDNTDLDRIKELATPRSNLVINSSKLARANSMLSSGYTQAEVAAALGVSVSTLNKAIHSE